jgi:hypothetical protein
VFWWAEFQRGQFIEAVITPAIVQLTMPEGHTSAGLPARSVYLIFSLLVLMLPVTKRRRKRRQKPHPVGDAVTQDLFAASWRG